MFCLVYSLDLSSRTFVQGAPKGPDKKGVWGAGSGPPTGEGVKVFRRPALMPQEMRSRGITRHNFEGHNFWGLTSGAPATMAQCHLLRSRFHVNHRARSPKIFRKKNGIVKAKCHRVPRSATEYRGVPRGILQSWEPIRCTKILWWSGAPRQRAARQATCRAGDSDDMMAMWAVPLTFE